MKKIPKQQFQLVYANENSKKKTLLQYESDEISPQLKKSRGMKMQGETSESQRSEKEELENNEASMQIQNKQNKRSEKDKKKFSWPIWKKLSQYTLKRKWLASIALILSILTSITQSLLPFKIGKVLDYITATSEYDTEKNTDGLKISLEDLTILIVTLALVSFSRYLSLQFLQEFISMDMKNDFYKIFMSKDLYFFEQYKSGELVSRLSSDVNQAKSAVSNNVTYLIRNVVLVLSNIIILYIINWKLAFIIMFIIPLYAIITRQYSKLNKVLVKQYQDVQAEVAAVVAQKFSGIQLVKAYSTQQKEIENYGSKILKGYYIQRKKLIITGLYNSVSQFLPFMGILAVLWYGGQMVLEKESEITAGELTTFIMYCSSLANSTSSISNSYSNIINGTFAVQKVFQMLQYKPQVDQSKGQNLNISGDIQFDNVTFKYPSSKLPIIKNLSLKIKKGQYIAFVGQSGSGKSTIIKIIQKFYKIESGNIYFGNYNQEDIKANHLRRQIGLVNQDATMFSGTIRQNITYGLSDYNVQDIEQSAERACCMEFLKDKTRFPDGIQSKIGERGSNISGGQKQRISIARALMRKPKIIIFDEATSALDSNSQQIVQTSIQKLALDNVQDKPTIIVIAHRLSTVMNTDRIVVMKDGQIVEMGSHNYLKSLKGYYYQLVLKQLGQYPQNIPE